MTTPIEQEDQAIVQGQQQLEIAGFRQVLKNRDFLRLWLAQLISQTIFNAANFGLIVLVDNLTHSVIMVGLVIIAFTLPAVLFSAVAGAVVDKLNKRLILWVSNILRAVTMLLMLVSLLSDRTNLFPIFVLIFVTSVTGQFFSPAEGASIPLLVGGEELMPALSLFNVTVTLAQAIGFLLIGRVISTIFPPFMLHIGTLTIHVLSIDMLFVFVAVCYIICASLVLSIPVCLFDEAHVRKPQLRISQIELGIALENLWHDMVESWHIVQRDNVLFFAVVQLSMAGVIMQMIGELAPTFVEQLLHRPAEDMSLVLAPAAVGLVGASILMPHISKRVGKVRLTVVALIVMVIGFLLLPVNEWLALTFDPTGATTLLLWTTMVLIFILGAAMSCINIPAQTLLQERAPDEGRARVIAFQFMLFNAGTIPVLLFAGAIAQYIGLIQLIVIVATGLLLFCCWGVWYLRKNGQQHIYE